MTTEGNIEAALLGRVANLSTSPALPVAWPNKNYAPSGGPYLRVDHLPNRNTRVFLNGSDPHYRQGILQLTIVAPLNDGPATATDVAGQVAAHFPADLSLYSDDVKVKIQSAPDLAPALKTDATWDVPVSVHYECFA